MLKQKPQSYYQSTIFSKKQKKRSCSTSQNKENIYTTHNNSIVLSCNQLNENIRLDAKINQNICANKNKSKKIKNI